MAAKRRFSPGDGMLLIDPHTPGLFWYSLSMVTCLWGQGWHPR